MIFPHLQACVLNQLLDYFLILAKLYANSDLLEQHLARWRMCVAFHRKTEGGNDSSPIIIVDFSVHL